MNNLPDDNSTVLKPEICEHLGLKGKCLVCELQEELAAVKAERDRMRDALEWFSDTRNYIHQSGMSPADKTPAVYREGRLRARAALSQPASDETITSISSECPSPEEALNWFSNRQNAHIWTIQADVGGWNIMSEDGIVAVGETPLDCIRSAMEAEKAGEA